MRVQFLTNQYSQQRQREKKRWIYPVLLAMQAEYYRRRGARVYWDEPCEGPDKIVTEPEALDFVELPAPDRSFTRAFDRKYQRNGNFKFHPATYMQVANGCWWGRCSFCVERNNRWQVRPVWAVHEELRDIKRLGFKEVFDDSGTFPIGQWLDEFLRVPIPGLTLGCNMRMVDVDYARMKRFGFRMVLFGLESVNQGTLDRIEKGQEPQNIRYIVKAAEAGLEPHVAVIFGYPWETDEDAMRTLRTVQELLKNGYAKTAQASFYSVLGVKGNEAHRKYVGRIYRVALSSKFWWNKLKDIRTMTDMKYLFRQIEAAINK